MKNIAIIGAGEIGSRHLQALALNKDKLNIYIVDPNNKSLEICLKRYKEVDKYKNKSIYTVNDIGSLPSIIEFAIIATTSKPRLNVLKKLLNHSIVKYMLVEKFLFPKVDEYDIALKLVKNHNVKAYVNCARRAWPIYKEIKNQILKDSRLTITVSGSNWNMASNSIHFLDLFFYYTNEQEIKISTADLDTDLFSNKRKDYIDFSGTLRAKSKHGMLTLISHRSGSSKIEIIIETEQHKCILKEGIGKLELYQKINKDFKRVKFKKIKQSELTHVIYQQLLKQDTCDLVPFELSVNHHLYLLNALNEFFGEREGVIT